mgnify:FL=1|tara:strand:+ start:217 stop:735 length:519 start_codon:yes stop_codon:yes gene_type:complete
MRKQETDKRLQWVLSLEMSRENNFHLSQRKIRDILTMPQDRRASKPNGVWYAPGSEWRSWTHSEMPSLLAKYKALYDIEITGSVLRIATPADVHEFMERYGRPLRPGLRHENKNPDWVKVAQDWAGIEVNPYHWDLRFTYLWYSGLDVPSGCVWDPSGASVRLVDFNEKENQ